MTTTIPTDHSAVTGPPRGRLTVVYLIHEAFRRDLGRLSRAVRTPGVTPERAERLRGHWDFVDGQLHHHHEVEDAALWPLLRPKLAGRPQALAVLDDMEAQHKVLEPRCQAVREAFGCFARTPDRATSKELGEALDALATALGGHLDAEESVCFPLIDRTMSPEEFEAFGRATSKAVGVRGSAAFFPWIFDGADLVERDAVLRMPPAPVRLLCRRVWVPRYQRRTATLWG